MDEYNKYHKGQLKKYLNHQFVKNHPLNFLHVLELDQILRTKTPQYMTMIFLKVPY